MGSAKEPLPGPAQHRAGRRAGWGSRVTQRLSEWEHQRGPFLWHRRQEGDWAPDPRRERSSPSPPRRPAPPLSFTGGSPGPGSTASLVVTSASRERSGLTPLVAFSQMVAFYIQSSDVLYCFCRTSLSAVRCLEPCQDSGAPGLRQKYVPIRTCLQCQRKGGGFPVTSRV